MKTSVERTERAVPRTGVSLSRLGHRSGRGILAALAFVAMLFTLVTPVNVAAETTLKTTGNMSILVIPITFDSAKPVYDSADLSVAFFGHGASALAPSGSIADWFVAASNGRLTVSGKVTRTFPLAMSVGGCDRDTIVAAASAAAAANGIAPSSYANIVVVFPRSPACPFAAKSNIGSPNIVVNGWMTDDTRSGATTTIHEIGHNLGLYHANGVHCSDLTSFGARGTLEACYPKDYGDPYNMMGGLGETDSPLVGLPDFDSYQATVLGWYDTRPVDVTSNGAWRLVSPRVGDVNGASRVLMIRRPDKTTLIVDIRAALHVDPREPAYPLVDGVTIRVFGNNADGMPTVGAPTLLVDLHPETTSSDALLRVGDRISDPLSGATISVTAIDPSGFADVSVSFTPNAPKITPINGIKSPPVAKITSPARAGRTLGPVAGKAKIDVTWVVTKGTTPISRIGIKQETSSSSVKNLAACTRAAFRPAQTFSVPLSVSRKTFTIAAIGRCYRYTLSVTDANDLTTTVSSGFVFLSR